MRMFTIAALGFLGLAACSANTTTSQQPEMQLSARSSSSLWRIQATTSSVKQLGLVETELVARGQTRSERWYIGQRSASAFGKKRFTRGFESGSADTRNCSDFPTSAAAQAFFLNSGGPSRDPHNLDRDGDGLACEWGARIRQIAQSSKPTVHTPRRTFSSRCYVGPRGGTYTITTSGRRNYGGC